MSGVSETGIFVVGLMLFFGVFSLWLITRIDQSEAARNRRNALALQHSLDHGVSYYWYEEYDGTFSLRRPATDRAA